MNLYGTSLTAHIHSDVALAYHELEQKLIRLCRPDIIESLDGYLSYCLFTKLPELQETVQELITKEQERKYKEYYGITRDKF